MITLQTKKQVTSPSDLTKNQLLTPADKVYLMSEKNPDLELLVKEFNLQFV